MTTKPNPVTKMMKPVRVYAPIVRIDKAERIVEGYCYVNAVVGDGIDLTRKSMIKASEDYMKWGAVRAMHGPVAAGTAEAVTWDDKGCFLRAKITDDAEWAKCENGTYKGFSVGVNPVVMRGNKTETVQWIENSLVDRPFDEDASFVIARADGLSTDALTAEVAVTILPSKNAPVSKNASAGAGAALFSAPVSDLLLAEGADITRIKTKKLAKMAKKIGKVSKALNNQYRTAEAELARRSGNSAPADTASKPPASPPVPVAEAATLTRLSQMEATLTRLQLDGASKDAALKKAGKQIEKTEKQIERAGKQIKRLSGQPAAGPQPVRFPAALERTFAANEATGGEASGEEVAALKSQYDALIDAAQKEPDANKRQEASHQIGLLAAQLAEYGGL